MRVQGCWLPVAANRKSTGPRYLLLVVTIMCSIKPYAALLAIFLRLLVFVERRV